MNLVILIYTYEFSDTNIYFYYMVGKQIFKGNCPLLGEKKLKFK